MNPSAIQNDLQQFKAEMLVYRPFFGDILLRLPIVQDDSIPTACTDGRTIRWSSRFFSTLTAAQRHYVLMHEVLHTLLMHPIRMEGYDPEIWNIAADMVVNTLCDRIANDVNHLKPVKLMERPSNGIFVSIAPDSTVESLYGMLQADIKKRGRTFSISSYYGPDKLPGMSRIEITPDSDLIPCTVGGRPLTSREKQILEQQISALLREAAAGSRGDFGSYFVPRELVSLTYPRPVPWRRMLREHLTQAASDDASYATPERKYLHMDLILPGYCLTEEGDLESLWAFVDSSGSISGDTLNQFLTQLYRIVKEFHCELNICYWDTRVTDIYRKIQSEKQVLKCQPHHTGGTDINCVYRWMEENHVKPYVILILTDGYFGTVSPDNRRCLRPHDTVLCISNESRSPEYVKIGKVCRLI